MYIDTAGVNAHISVRFFVVVDIAFVVNVNIYRKHRVVFDRRNTVKSKAAIGIKRFCIGGYVGGLYPQYLYRVGIAPVCFSVVLFIFRCAVENDTQCYIVPVKVFVRRFGKPVVLGKMAKRAVVVSEYYLYLIGSGEEYRICYREISVIIALLFIFFMRYDLFDLCYCAQLAVFAVSLCKLFIDGKRLHRRRVARHEHTCEQQYYHAENNCKRKAFDRRFDYAPDPARFCFVLFLFIFFFVFVEHLIIPFFFVSGSVELHVAVLYPAYASEDEVKCVGKYCGKDEAYEYETYPIECADGIRVAV